MPTLTINKFMAEPPVTPAGKDYTIFAFNCDGTVDGEPALFKCKTFNKSSAELVKAGATIENAEAKEFRGETEYLLPKVGGGAKFAGKSGGGWKPDPARDLSILKQCVFKGAVELAAHDKLEMKKMTTFIDYWVKYLSDGKPAPAAKTVEEEDQGIPF